MDPAESQFSLGELLSVTTGVMLADGGMSAVLRLLEFMTGGHVHTQDVAATTRRVRRELVRQFPFLDGLQSPAKSVARAWLREQERLYGQFRTVSRP